MVYRVSTCYQQMLYDLYIDVQNIGTELYLEYSCSTKKLERFERLKMSDLSVLLSLLRLMMLWLQNTNAPCLSTPQRLPR